MATENDNKKHECSHEHKHETEFPKMSKYDEALSKYNTEIDDAEVREAVKKIIAEKVHENDTPEIKKFLFGSIELTSLKTTDSEESILAFTEKVNEFDATYPDLPTWQQSAYIHALPRR